ncbi:MAG: CocE/NonD family hydrolase [Thermodesulfobacteriota bacterium]|nr:CocE/NonD family hydrolase [Thermodesulfobacteriota bacterium]
MRILQKRLRTATPVVFLGVVTVVAFLFSTVVFADAATTTLGTRGTLSQSNTPVLSNAGAQWADYDRDPVYPNAVTLPLEFFETRAGDMIAVLVSVPADEAGNPIPGQFPAVLSQTAYRMDLANLMGSFLPGYATLVIGGRDDYLIKRGYVSVTVDCRGLGMSTGVTEVLGEAEQAAYADTVDWITEQPWFDGNLGLAGTSYQAINALLTAEQQHPAVKAVFAEVPMGDAYRGTVGPGGLLNANFIKNWLTLTQNLSVTDFLGRLLYPEFEDLITEATQDHIDAIDAWYLPTIFNSLDNMTGYATDDGDFWAIRSPIEKANTITVPTFIIGGTNDIFQRCEPLLYEQLKNNVTTKLVILPGAHLPIMLGATVSSNTLLADGPISNEKMLLQWFDQYLKGMDTNTEAIPNVTQYVEGYGRTSNQSFSTATDWPHPEASPLRFYLRGNMRLSERTPYFWERPHDIYEPEAPVVTVSGPDENGMVTGEVEINDGSDCSASAFQWSLGMGLPSRPCFTDDNKVETAQDALIFETRRMTEDLYINGPMQADIWMSATNPQAALAIRINDVDLFGNATPISTGLQSAAYRAVDENRSRYVDGVMVQPWHPFTAASMQPLTPDEPVLVRVEIFPAAALIKRGHRLRIAISSSNQAEGIWPLPLQEQAAGNVTTIYNDAKHPSSLVVLSVPTSELN